jgi:hypothetical protein
MHASLEDVVNVIKSKGAPKIITQEPFDYDPGHYQRLCLLRGDQPTASDLENYALDMKYMKLQPDLLRYLTPILLTAWRRDLFEGDAAGYGGFVEYFWPALLEGEALKTVYTDRERAAFTGYIRNSILDRLDAESALQFSGMGASPYRWVQSLVSYGVVFSDVEALWDEWWQTKTPGHAMAAFQYASALMYEAERNPIFAPWTREKGGGAPALWDCGCHMFDVGWIEDNLSFLRRTLSVAYFKERLENALSRIQAEPAQTIASCIVRDLPEQEALLALRIEELPRLLANVSDVGGFTI